MNQQRYIIRSQFILRFYPQYWTLSFGWDFYIPIHIHIHILFSYGPTKEMVYGIISSFSKNTPDTFYCVRYWNLIITIQILCPNSLCINDYFVTLHPLTRLIAVSVYQMNPSGFFIVKIMALFGEPLFVLQCSLPTSKAGDKGTAFLGYIHLSTISHCAIHYMHEKPTLVHFLITNVRWLIMKGEILRLSRFSPFTA